MFTQSVEPKQSHKIPRVERDFSIVVYESDCFYNNYYSLPCGHDRLPGTLIYIDDSSAPNYIIIVQTCMCFIRLVNF